MNEHGWISIHEEEPPKNPVNPANSVQVQWCDAESDIPEYAQSVGTFWYGTEKMPAFFDGGGRTAFVVDVAFTASNKQTRKRDLYWKHLSPMPAPVKR